MELKRPFRRSISSPISSPVYRLLPFILGLSLLAVAGCKRSGVKEARITGRATDLPTAMPVQWQAGKRYLYRLEVGTSSMVPRRTTGKPIQAETTLGMDLSFGITNAASSEIRVVDMKVLAVQMDMSHDGGTILTFDSDNKTIPAEENPLADRLQRLVGTSLRFFLSPENKVTRVDGMKDLNDRLSTGGNTVRGVGAEVLRRFFNQQFFRDVLEMGMFRQDPVRIGETWKETHQGNAGLWGTSAPLELEFKFRGWQRRDGTNCARVDFTGHFQPTLPVPPNNGNAGTNPPPPRVANRGNAANEEGTLTGQVWYNPELSLGVELVYDQAMTKRSSAGNRANVIRRPGNQGGTNQPMRLAAGRPPPPSEPAATTDDPLEATAPAPRPAPTAPPANGAVKVMTNMSRVAMAPGSPPGTNATAGPATTSQWHVTLKLLEIETLQQEKPALATVPATPVEATLPLNSGVSPEPLTGTSTNAGAPK